MFGWIVRKVGSLVNRVKIWKAKRDHNRLVAEFSSIPFIQDLKRPKSKKEVLEALNRLDEESRRPTSNLGLPQGGLPGRLEKLRQELKHELENRGEDKEEQDDFRDLNCMLIHPNRARKIIWDDELMDVDD